MSQTPIKQDKGALYMRVSTRDQSNEPQRHELREWAQRHGVNVLYELDDVLTGTRWTRTGLDKLTDLVERKKINVVICYKLDRLGRSMARMAQIVEQYKHHGCAIVSTSQGIDTRASSPMGRLQMNMLMVFAEFERDLLIERTNIGIKEARRKGIRIGRPPATEKKMPRRWREIVEQWEAEGGKGQRTLAKRLGVGVATINRMLKLKQAETP